MSTCGNEVLRSCSALGVLSALGHTGGTSTSTSGDGPISRHHPEKHDLGFTNGGDSFHSRKGPDDKSKNRDNYELLLYHANDVHAWV